MRITSDHKRAATRLGIAACTYERMTRAGWLWCWVCQDFHHKTKFGRDASRPTGRAAVCRASRVKGDGR